MLSDRRTFLRRAAAACLAGPVAASSACDGTRREGAAADVEASTPEAARITRPVLLAAAPDAVRLLDPVRDRPLAYLSRAERRVYVDPDFRDRAEQRLAAYISVTTGVWRIPLPEDDPRVPITPGDELREFEEVDLREWDPRVTPAEGDARLRAGAPVRVRVHFICEPVLQDDGWVSGGPFVIERRDGPAGDGGREDFGSIGLGTRHRDRACQDAGEPVRLLAWSADA